MVGSARMSDMESPSCGLITCRRDRKGPVHSGSGSSRRRGPRRPDLWTWKLALGTWNVTSLAGKEPELVREVERYRLEIVGLTSTHSLGSPWTLIITAFRLERSYHPVSGERTSPIQDTARPRARITTFDCRDLVDLKIPWQMESYHLLCRVSQSPRERGPTLAPEVELHYDSDQGCEPMTSVDEGEETMDNEDWLINFSEKLATPTLSHPVLSSSLFLDSTMDYDLFSSTCIDCVIFTVILSRFLLPPSSHARCLQPCAVSVEVSCYDVESQVAGLAAPPGSLTLLAPSWSVITPLPPRTPSTPTAAEVNSFPFVSPLSSITPAPTPPSGTLAPPSMSVATATPWSPVSAMLLNSIDSPSAPVDPSASSPSVVPKLSSASIPSWLLPPSTPPWAVCTGKLWVCASVLSPPLPKGDHHPAITIPLPRPAITTHSPLPAITIALPRPAITTHSPPKQI
ncbi:hypothetical protein PO909_008575 [Leuciscus waleckii]